MKIGIDMRLAGEGYGVGRYAWELVRHIVEEDEESQYVLYFRSADYAHDSLWQHDNVVVRVVSIPHYSVAEQTKFPKLILQDRLDLVHFLHFNATIFYPWPFVVTIPDLTHHIFPGRKKRRIIHRLGYRLVISAAAKRARKVITVSHASKEEIVKHLQIPEEKIAVIYEGVQARFRPIQIDLQAQVKAKYGIRKSYLIHVGVMRRYKNIPILARAFDVLRSRGHDFALVLAGEWDPYYPDIKEEVFAGKYRRDIMALGLVPDEDLPALLSGARLFVMPSLLEGFGLPPLEAMSCRVPVVASNILVLREILGDAAVFFDPYDPVDIADAMERVLKEDSLRQELVGKGLEQVKKYSWEKAAQETLNVYREVVGVRADT